MSFNSQEQPRDINNFCGMSSVKVGKYSYAHEVKSIGNATSKVNIIVGNYTGINSITISAWDDYGHTTSKISNFPFGYHSPELTNVQKFRRRTYNIDKVKNHTVKIGNDVWIGANVTIKSGITIGDGAIIGFNSNVTKNISPYEIVGGNPVKHIRFKYEKNIIDEFLKIKWWDWDLQKMKQCENDFLNLTPEEFVNTHRINK